MAFEADAATVYQVRPRHRNEEVRERVPADYAGVMIADRGRSYDAAELAGVRQQKCLAHVLRSLSEVLATKSRGAGAGLRRPGVAAGSGDHRAPAGPGARRPGQPAVVERIGPVPRRRLAGAVPGGA